MRSRNIFAAVAITATALADSRLRSRKDSPAETAIIKPTPATHEPFRYAPAKKLSTHHEFEMPKPTLASKDAPNQLFLAPSPTTTTNPQLADKWFPFSWGTWMLPPLTDIECSSTAPADPFIGCDGTGFCWGLPPRDLEEEEQQQQPPAEYAEQAMTELDRGRWGFAPREGVTCVGTSTAPAAPSSTSPTTVNQMTVDPIIGCDGTGFCWGLPPREHELVSGNPSGQVSTTTGNGDGAAAETAAKRQVGDDASTVTETATHVVTSTVAPTGVWSSSSAGTSGASTPSSASHVIPTLSASTDTEPFTVSSAWVDGLPPPIPFSSIIKETVTLTIAEHGTRVADSSTWFGPWPESTELPAATSPITFQTTPSTFRTLTSKPMFSLTFTRPSHSTTTTDGGSATVTATSIRCNEAYCAEDGTSYCFYWAGVTAMGQEGPEPGETRIPMGTCSVSAAAAPTTAATSGGLQRGHWEPWRIHLF